MAMVDPETVGAEGGDWTVFAIARSQASDREEAEELFASYRDNMRIRAKETRGILSEDLPTENAKAVLVLSAIGEDPSDVEGYDLTERLDDYEDARAQGINAEIWDLIAASSAGVQLKHHDDYVQDILACQLEDGAIMYGEGGPDVDITAMAIQALAKEEDADIKAAVTAARNWLAGEQQADGSYGNCESTAQVIIALACLGEDPAEAEDFVKEGKGLTDGLMKYQVADGFCHEGEESANGMSTEQALCALDAVRLAGEGKALY